MNEGLSTLTEPAVRPNTPESRKPVIRILIADDHPIVRDGLRKLLTLESDFEVIGEASTEERCWTGFMNLNRTSFFSI